MAAAVFAVHPVHIESVARIIERKDVLSGMFYLLAATAWVRFAETAAPALVPGVAGGLRRRPPVQVGGGHAAGGTAHLALVEARPRDLERCAADCAVFVVGGAITVADLLFNRSCGVGGFGYSLIERALIAARAFWFYVGKLFWPFDLAGIYPHWEVREADPLGSLGVGAAVALVAALWLLRRRIGRGPLARLLFFGVTLSPVLGFVDFNYMLFSFVADRYQYLASIGITTVAVADAARGNGCTPAAPAYCPARLRMRC